MQLLKLYMMKKGIPAKTIDEIRTAFISDAVREGTAMKYDRIFVALALAIRRAYGFGAQRIAKGLHEFDVMCCDLVDDNEKNWDDYMMQLRNETGIVIVTDPENRVIVEYHGDDIPNEEIKEG